MFSSAYAPIDQPPNRKTTTLAITHVGGSTAHFPQRSQPRASSAVSLDPLWGLHAAEHKADIQNGETTEIFSNGRRVSSTELITVFSSWHILITGPSIALIVRSSIALYM